jgi:hypothetical protein
MSYWAKYIHIMNVLRYYVLRSISCPACHIHGIAYFICRGLDRCQLQGLSELVLACLTNCDIILILLISSVTYTLFLLYKFDYSIYSNE